MLLAEPKIKDGKDLRRPDIFSERQQGMAAPQETGNKLPRSMDDLQEIEDRLAKMQADLRDIRAGMKESGMSTVKLSLGTFVMCIDRMEPLAKKYKGEFERQKSELHAQTIRERKKAELASRNRNQNRK